jgi:heme A synthase
LTPTLHEPVVRTNTAFTRFVWGVLVYNVAVSLWGAYVRASGSGDGCGANWPLCNGVLVPVSSIDKTRIEFTHRLTTGIDMALVAVLIYWAFRQFPKAHPARLGAVLSGVFLMTEALIGASLVLLRHVAGNTSPYRIYSLSTHLINTLTLLGCISLTALWASGRRRTRFQTRDRFALAAIVLLGITGAIAALGDTLFPVHSLAEGIAQDFTAGANIFVRLRWLHPMIAVAAAVGVVWYAMSRGIAESRWVLGLLAAQLFAGALNLVLMAPIWMQMLHLGLAYGFWIALVMLCAIPRGASKL